MSLSAAAGGQGIPPASRYPMLALVALCSGLSLAGCAQQPVNQGEQGVRRNHNTSEYFPEGRYGKASPRVVADGRVVPRGGGRRLVGKPYRIAGKRYVPREFSEGHSQTGKSSWYGDAFHGRKTANGEIYDMSAVSAAHPTMPLPSYARVTNLKNGHSIIVRVNDRGPYHGGRIIDVSKRVADALDFRRSGTAQVKVDYVGPAGIAGSDDRRLMASLTTNGRPAQMDGTPGPLRTMIAAVSPSAIAVPSAASGGRLTGEAPPSARGAIIHTTQQPASQPTAVATRGPVGEPGTSVVALSSSRSIPVTAAPSAVPEVAPSASSFAGRAPLPPPRPFDLATIPGADAPIAALNRSVLRAGGSAPPRPSQARAPAFFAPHSAAGMRGPVLRQLEKRKPFEHFHAGAGFKR